jgi:hypothetical protein
MKKLLAALSAAGLVSLGISSALGATAANASIRPHAPFAVTVSKTTGLSTTANTKLKVKITGASKGDALEAGICNDDASQTSPLSDPTDACTSPDIAIAPASGSVSITLTLKPGLQGSDPLSGCPASSSQTGLGISCIVAAADLTASETADVPLYFKNGKVTVTGTGGVATITVKSGFETAGLVGSSPSTLTGPCQAFSGTVAGGAAPWTTDPLCDDADNAPAGVGGPYPAGYGFAAGEAVLAYLGTTEVGGAQADADAPVPVATPGGVTVTLGSALPAGKYTIDLVGSGYTAGANASGVTVKVTVKVSASGKVT